MVNGSQHYVSEQGFGMILKIKPILIIFTNPHNPSNLSKSTFRYLPPTRKSNYLKQLNIFLFSTNSSTMWIKDLQKYF